MKPIFLLLLLGLVTGCAQREASDARIAALESEVRQLKQSLADAHKQIADGNELRKVIAAAAGEATQTTAIAAQTLDARVAQLETVLPQVRAETEALGKIVQAMLDSMQDAEAPATNAAPPP